MPDYQHHGPMQAHRCAAQRIQANSVGTSQDMSAERLSYYEAGMPLKAAAPLTGSFSAESL